MNRRRTLLASALLIGLSTLFCTLGPSGSRGDATAPISDSERIAALDEISQVAQDSMLPEGQIDRPALFDFRPPS